LIDDGTYYVTAAGRLILSPLCESAAAAERSIGRQWHATWPGCRRTGTTASKPPQDGMIDSHGLPIRFSPMTKRIDQPSMRGSNPPWPSP
jgi:hypothetical protein